MSIEWIVDGGVTSPEGFEAGGSYAGIKTYGPEPRRDVGLLVARRPCVAAALFTRNRVQGAPVIVSREHIENQRARAIVVNSGCSNVAMGAAGIEDARAMAGIAADHLGIEPGDVLVASTGVIARRLPLDRIRQGIQAIEPSREGDLDFSRAIMTTDRVMKRRALRFQAGGRTYTLGGAAKGSGMAHPDMATVLAFLTTDAPVSGNWARTTLKHIADGSFNMLNIDLDTSTSDSLFWLASGEAGGEPIDDGHPAAAPLAAACGQLCEELTRDLARDGEGARSMIQVEIRGAANLEEARRAAHVVVSSPLIKTMVTGRDPNVGRVMMAVGRAGVELRVDEVAIVINGVEAYSRGTYHQELESQLCAAMDSSEVEICVDLKAGDANAVAWGCDLTEDYVRINADYTT
jgi:glutamate N-acetyltransferase/amino-acid N-acetyltransferase